MEGVVIMDPNFWHGRKVFLTGHTGFKGSWLSLLLSDWGAEVHGYALAAVEESLFRHGAIEDVMASSEIADIRHAEALTAALRRSEADVVFHMAAQPLVRLSYRDPVDTYSTNVMGTVHLLEACRRVEHVKAVLVVTSDKCYENREWEWGYRENEAMGGHDPYSNSKGCAELVTAAYRDSFLRGAHINVGSGRAGNVIGGGDYSEDRLVPDLIRAVAVGESAQIRNPSAIRPWQHVLEPLSGYVMLAERLAASDGAAFAEGWNFGPSSSGDRNVGDVTEALYRHWGAGAWKRDEAAQPHEAHYLKLDSSKARLRLGWRPRWDFEDTIARTTEWYKARTEGRNMRDVTRHQITSYLAAPGI